jgi:hypothetical protein
MTDKFRAKAPSHFRRSAEASMPSSRADVPTRGFWRTSVAAIAALAVCSGAAPGEEPAATKAEITAALWAHFATHCATVPAPSPGVFPVHVLEATAPPGNGAQYEALVRAGLVMRRNENPAQLIWGDRSETVEFDLTAKGRSLFEPAGSSGAGSPAGFCAGKIQVQSVDRFTKPINVRGRHIAQASFTVQIELDKWVQNRLVQTAFADRVVPAGARAAMVDLALGDGGWAVESTPEFFPLHK